MINIGDPYNWKLLKTIGWSEDNIENFIPIYDVNHTNKNFQDSLYDIIDYKLPFNSADLQEDLGNPNIFHEKGISNFFKGKTQNDPQQFDELIDTVKSLNLNRKNNGVSDGVIIDLRNSYIYIENQKSKLQNLSNEDILEWSKFIKQQKNKDISEIISYINQLFQNIFDYYLRKTQIISVLLLMKKDKNSGRIAQILTGEGKTAIIITLAAINVILGHKVDIVTSSEILAKRDAENEKNKKIFEYLGITVDHCIKDPNNKERGPRKCYLADIVYGDAHNFQADILSDEYMLEGTRNNRGYDVIIVDEIDSMFVDDYGRSTLLSREMPYMKRLNYILISMWIVLNNNIQSQSWTIEEIKKNKKSIAEKLSIIAKNTLAQMEGILPEYLKKYAENELKEKWPNKAIEAVLMVENERYRVHGDKIEPVDNENTGVIQHNTHLSYGLQQFLQLKHDCSLTAVSTISSYLSNVGFFRLYINKEKKRNNIFGLTGTLGSQTAQDLLHDIYNLDFVFIPPASQRMLIQLSPRLEINDIDWMKSILSTCLREAKSGREVLIICKTIKVVQDIHKELKAIYDGKKIYTLKDDIEAEQNFEELEPGSIIIATNLAGRGTDIPISPKVLENGGMHVCLTFLPINIRVQEQAFGRAGRKGQPGTWQLVHNVFKGYPEDIINKNMNVIKECTSFGSKYVRSAFDKENKNKNEILKKLNEMLDEAKKKKSEIFIENLDWKRENDENEMLNNAKLEIEKVIKKDELFIKYTKFLKDNFPNRKTRVFNDIEEQWGFFLNRVEGKEQEEIQKLFSEFIDDLKKEKSNSTVMKNSGFICQIVDNTLYDNIPDKDGTSIIGNILNTIISWFSNKKEKIEDEIRYAARCCKRDIDMNPELSFITYYYYAITDIFLGYISDAKKNLNKSIKLINRDIEFLVTFASMISGFKFEKLQKSLEKKFNLYNNIKEAILQSSLKLVNDADDEILIKKKRLINAFNFTDIEKIKEDIESLYILGFDSVYFLYEKAPWYVRLAVIGFGVLTICVGYLIKSVPILNLFSDRIISTGINNIVKGIEMCFNGENFKNFREFMDFQKASFFAKIWFEPLIIEKDKKLEYKFYHMYLKDNDLLREKIIINREKKFKNFIEDKLKEIDLNIEEEDKKIKNIEKNISKIKEKVAEKIMNNLKGTKCYRNVFLYFDGNIDNIRKYLLNKIFSQLLNYNITKDHKFEEDLNEDEIIEKISKELEKKIIEEIEKDDDIKKNSLFLNDFKNKMVKKKEEENNKEIKDKYEEFNKRLDSKNQEHTKDIEKINNDFMEKQKELNNEFNQKLQDKNNKAAKEIINNINQKIEYFNEKQNELSEEEKEKLKKEIESTDEKINEQLQNNQKEIKKELQENINEEKIKFEGEKTEKQNKYNKVIEDLQKEKEELNKKIEEKMKEDIQTANKLNNDDFEFKEGKLICNNLSINKDFGEEYLNKYNKDKEKNIQEYDNIFGEKIKYMTNEQVSNIEVKDFNNSEKNQRAKIDIFKNSIDKKGNPVVKCLSQKYEYYSVDIEILGKQIMKKFPEYVYFVDNNIKSLKEKIKQKNILVGNYNDSKSWNTICIIPEGDKYIILYKNPKGLNYDNKFIDFLTSIGINKYLIKINKIDQLKEIEKSSCIISLKNLEVLAESLKNNKQNYIDNFENAEFKLYTKEELSNIRKGEFLKLYLKNSYENLKRTKNDNTEIDLFEIIDDCADREYSDKLYDFLDIIYEQLETFITDEEKERFKQSIKKYKENKIKYEDNEDD